jgi:hypothetical protein
MWILNYHDGKQGVCHVEECESDAEVTERPGVTSIVIQDEKQVARWQRLFKEVLILDPNPSRDFYMTHVNSGSHKPEVGFLEIILYPW